jgi:hypothetical protein
MTHLSFYRWIVTLPGVFTPRIQQREPGILAGRRILPQHQTQEDGSQSATDLQRFRGRPVTQRSTYSIPPLNLSSNELFFKSNNHYHSTDN